MTQAVSRRPLTAEARVRYYVSLRHVSFVVAFGQFSTRVFPFPPLYAFPATHHTHLHWHLAITRGTEGWSPNTFHKTLLFRKSGSTEWKLTFTILNNRPNLARRTRGQCLGTSKLFCSAPSSFTVSSLLRLYLITGLQYLTHLDGTC
jgi:hypothetical protein